MTFCFIALLFLTSALISFVLPNPTGCPWLLQLLQFLFHLPVNSAQDSLVFSTPSLLADLYSLYLWPDSGWPLTFAYTLVSDFLNNLWLVLLSWPLTFGFIAAVFLSLHPLFHFGSWFHCISWFLTLPLIWFSSLILISLRLSLFISTLETGEKKKICWAPRAFAKADEDTSHNLWLLTLLTQQTLGTQRTNSDHHSSPFPTKILFLGVSSTKMLTTYTNLNGSSKLYLIF